jgi:tetratricopeptide (TPR) repeat protein
MPLLAWIATALFWLAFATTLPAHAQAAPLGAHDEEARALFEAGRVAYEDGRYADALGYFERSFELSHRTALHYNLGLAYDRLRRDREALAAFEAYLDAAPDPDRTPEVQNRVRALRESIAAEDAAARAREAQANAPVQTKRKPERDEAARIRKRRLWLGIAAGAVALGAGVAISVVAARGGSDERSPPNSGVTFEALTWR